MSLSIHDNTPETPEPITPPSEKKKYAPEVIALAKKYKLKRAFVEANLERVVKTGLYISENEKNRFSLMGQLRELFQDSSVEFVPASGFWFEQGNAKNNFHMRIGLDIHEVENHINDPKNEFYLKRLLFSGFHEGAHYLDMIRNPTSQERARIVGAYSWYFATKHSVNKDFAFTTGYFLHRLHNAVDDTIVNDMVSAKTIFGTDKSYTNFPRELYATQLFASYKESNTGDYLMDQEKGKYVPVAKGTGTHVLQDGTWEQIDYTLHRFPEQFSYSLLRSHMIPDQKIVHDEIVEKILGQSVFKSIGELEKKITEKLLEAKSVFEPDQYGFLVSLFDFMKDNRRRILSKELSALATKTPREILAQFQKTLFRNGKRITSIPKADRIDIMRTFMDPLYLGLILLQILKDGKISLPEVPPEAYWEWEGWDGWWEWEGEGEWEENDTESDESDKESEWEEGEGTYKSKDSKNPSKEGKDGEDNKDKKNDQNSTSDNKAKSGEPKAPDLGAHAEIIKKILESLKNEEKAEQQKNTSARESQRVANRTQEDIAKIMANERNDAMKELLEKEGTHLTDDQVKHLLAQYDAVFAEAKPYIERLAKIWEERIISMISEHQEKLLEHVKKSDELDVEKAIDRISDILSGANPEELWIYLREQLETKFILRPNILRVRLILDNSGSMKGSGKIEQCVLFSVILSKSLERLTSMVNEKLWLQGEGSFFADTEIWKFGSEWNAKRLKKFSSSLANNGNSLGHTFIDKNIFATNLITSIAELDASDSSTCDAEVWSAIRTELDTQKNLIGPALESGNLIECVFEITDGETQTPEVKKHWKTLQKDFPKLRLGTILVGASDVSSTWEGIWHAVPNSEWLLQAMEQKILGELESGEFFSLETRVY